MRKDDTNYLPITLVIIVLVIIVLGSILAFSWGGGMMGMGMMGGGGVFMFIPFLFILLLVLIVIWALERRPTQHYASYPAYQTSEDPLLVLNQRFARGEITRELYLQMKNDMMEKKG
ncbi:MAG: hypothetical protein ACE5IO_04055 [Thermoplasmata archaeon]